MLRVETVTSGDWADRLRGPWGALLADGPAPTPFQSLDWLESYQSVWSLKPVVQTVWEGDDLLAAYPLTKTSVGVIRSMGVGPSDYLHPLFRKRFNAEAEGRVLEGLSPALFDLHQVPEIHYSAGFSFEKWEQASCLVLHLPATFDAYLATLSKSLRYEVRRIGGKQFRERGARIVDFGPDDIDQGLDIFMKLHAARWRSRGLPGAFMGRTAKFQRIWSRKAAATGALWLRALEVDGAFVGAIYVMRAGRSAFFYQAGMDPAAKALSPGTVLVGDTIRKAIEEGCTRFDFMRGDEPYKRRWAPQEALTNVRMLKATNAKGRAMLEVARKAFDVELSLRARFEGGSLLNRPSGP